MIASIISQKNNLLLNIAGGNICDKVVEILFENFIYATEISLS